MGYLEREEIIGHAALRGFLARSLKNKRHHAFLLSGAEHLGKDTVARAVASEELGRPVRQWSDLASHPDVKILSREEGEKNIGIAALRDFIRHFSSSSLLGGRKLGFILGAHDLSAEAANALLKTLEEPSGKALIVLTAHGLDRLPETVKSRCQMARFLPVCQAEIESGLIRMGFDEKEAGAAAAFASGRPGLAISRLGDPAAREEHSRCVQSFMGMISAPLARRLSVAGELASKADHPELASILDAWIMALRDALSLKTGNARYAALRAEAGVLQGYAAGRTIAQLVAAIRTTVAGKRMLSENVNPRLVFEHIALTI